VGSFLACVSVGNKTLVCLDVSLSTFQQTTRRVTSYSSFLVVVAIAVADGGDSGDGGMKESNRCSSCQ
jgi:hypothetical protein